MGAVRREVLARGKGVYNTKSPQLWLQAIRDYMAGRHSDKDPLLDWGKKQVDQIEHRGTNGATCGGVPNGLLVDLPGLQEVSRQLWALTGPLVTGDSSVHAVFANCPP